MIVQPTYVITGFESDAMKKEVLASEKDFDSIVICDSLIVTQQDKEEVCQALIREYHPAPEISASYGTRNRTHRQRTLPGNGPPL